MKAGIVLNTSVSVCVSKCGSGDVFCSLDHHSSGCKCFGECLCLFRWVSKISLLVLWTEHWLSGDQTSHKTDYWFTNAVTDIAKFID